MGAQKTTQLVCDTPSPGVRVARFLRPDMRDHLYDSGSIADCSLYQELHNTVLADLKPGETVVLNFGLIDWFITAFYRLLLRVKEEVAAHHGHLLFCCLTPHVKEAFGLMGGDLTFAGLVRDTEDRALHAVSDRP